MTPPLRYVVLHHTGIENPHYDLMLDLDGTSDLPTWRTPHWPPQPLDEFTPLLRHRRDYLTYEGPVSNNRGQVKRIAAGTYRIIDDSPTRLMIATDNATQLSLPQNI